jgi:hypothetical protein
MLLSFIILSSLIAQENVISNESGLDVFFKENIGNEMSVTILNLDITITGTLLTVYKDSIIIQAAIGKIQYLIPKISIAFAKIKNE